MEIFIDLANIAETKQEGSLPGVELNLSGLVDFNKPEIGPSLQQTPLKTESELNFPAFNPIEYFEQIQEEFEKIRASQESFSIKDDLKVLAEAQQNSSVALDPLAAYLEQRFNTIETITKDKSEIRELIRGASENTFTSDIESSIITNSLKQVESLEKDNSMESIANSINALIDSVIGNSQPKESPQVNPSEAISNQLVNNQETRFDQTSQNILSLSETISNFATSMINGDNTTISESPLSEVKRETLSAIKELPKPDFGAASLSALQRIAGTNEVLSNSAIVSNNTTSQFNTTNLTGEPMPAQPAPSQTAPENANTVIMSGQGGDLSSIYLVQMLNLLKSGQLKVKLT